MMIDQKLYFFHHINSYDQGATIVQLYYNNTVGPTVLTSQFCAQEI